MSLTLSEDQASRLWTSIGAIRDAMADLSFGRMSRLPLASVTPPSVSRRIASRPDPPPLRWLKSFTKPPVLRRLIRSMRRWGERMSARLPWFSLRPSEARRNASLMPPAEALVYTVLMLRVMEKANRSWRPCAPLHRRTGLAAKQVEVALSGLARDGHIIELGCDRYDVPDTHDRSHATNP